MKKIITLLLLTSLINCQNHTKTKILIGYNFSEEIPKSKPIVFSKGIVSTDMNEVNAAFSIDGHEFFFSRFFPGFGYKIMKMNRDNNSWSEPKIASFSGKYSDVDIFISPDRKQYFFVSKRPINDSAEISSGYQIWQMQKTNKRLSKPVLLDSIINFGKRQLYPTCSMNGTLYFNSDGLAGYGKGDFYKSEFINNQYSKPVNLGDSINTIYDETDIFIAKNEEYVIFTSIDRPDGFGGGDLYISFNLGNNMWSKSMNMGDNINTKTNEYSAIVSPDGKFLFFTSNRNGNDDIYWVDASIIETYKRIIK